MSETLSRRALNRAYLSRQLLLERAEMGPRDALEHLVGLQAQAPWPPYIALWSRLAAFDPHELGRLIVERHAARIAVMRSTIHLLSDRDCLPIRRLTQPVIERGAVATRHRVAFEGVETDTLAVEARKLLAEKPMTMRELGERLRERWPAVPAESLAYAVRALVPLVQLPPRGVWGRSGQPLLAPADQWLEDAEPRELSLENLVLRYLAAFGPATVKDMQAWSGLTRLSEIVEPLRRELRTYRDEKNAELFDLADVELPGEDVEAPVRFLPEFDNATLSHADRTRIVEDEFRKRIATRNGMVPGTFLVDGFVAGTWTVRRARDVATLRIEEYRRLAAVERAAIEEEGRRLVGFTQPEVESVEVEFRVMKG